MYKSVKWKNSKENIFKTNFNYRYLNNNYEIPINGIFYLNLTAIESINSVTAIKSSIRSIKNKMASLGICFDVI